MTASEYAKLIGYKKWADSGLYRVVAEQLDRLADFDKVVVLQVLDHMHAVDRTSASSPGYATWIRARPLDRANAGRGPGRTGARA